MNNEERDTDETSLRLSGDEATTPLEDEPHVEVNNPFEEKSAGSLEKDITSLKEDIIRNDTIPETSRDTPGSIGVFPVGAFDTSKD